MNPKDMTNKHLIDSVCEAISICDLDAANKFQQELLRRLDEADALRKENEELRKDNSILNDRLKRANPTTLDSFYGEFS